MLTVAVGLVAVGCSSAAPPVSTMSAEADAATRRIEEQSRSSEEATPATRAQPNVEEVADDWQIGWLSMNEQTVELEWQPASAGATYNLFRVLSIENDPSTVDLSSVDAIYTGPATSFVDESVEPDTFYTYIVTSSTDDVDRRWTDTLTTTDTTAPDPIVGLNAQVVSGHVELTWQPSTDDVEFASYAVSLLGQDGELTYIGGGSDESAATFIDDRWTGEETTYVVQAVDFHNNRTAPVEITVS